MDKREEMGWQMKGNGEKTERKVKGLLLWERDGKATDSGNDG